MTSIVGIFCGSGCDCSGFLAKSERKIVGPVQFPVQSRIP